MKKETPLILITNDDGIDSPGIFALYQAMKPLGRIIVVAPDKQQSAVSSSLTIQKPIKVNKKYINDEFFGFAVDGTPTDCVKLAFFSLLEEKPDLVISGINHGLNTSINVLYSGTVSGAIEGMLMDVNAIAVSHASHSTKKDLTAAADVAGKIAKEILNSDDYNKKYLLNINIPDINPLEIKGIKITRLSNSQWIDKFDKRFDPYGNEYYWFTGEYIVNDDDPECDDNAVNNGFISVSPLSIDFTDYNSLNDLKRFEKL